jgi:hypothetical protein
MRTSCRPAANDCAVVDPSYVERRLIESGKAMARMSVDCGGENNNERRGA